MTGRPPRLLFIDNLRWSAICMVVVIHAAVTYSGLGSWYVRDVSGTGRALAIGLGTYQSFQHSVAMGLLFGIAGYFARRSVEGKGAAAFLKERAVRLGLPLLLYLLLIGPVTQYFIVGAWHGRSRSFGAAWFAYIAQGGVFSGSGPLWFCLVLLVFSAGYVLVRGQPRSADRAVPGLPVVLGYALVMASLAFAVGLVAPAGATLLNVDVHDFPQYPLMFAAGVMAHRYDWLRRIPSRTGAAWGVGGLAAGAVGWALLIGLGGALQGHLGDYYHGWHWQAAGMDLWRAGVCLSLTLGLLTLYRDQCNTQGRVSRFLTRNAFGVYVFHAPILIGATQILHDWPVDAVVKFGGASLAGIVLTFLFVGVVARRIPGLRAII